MTTEAVATVPAQSAEIVDVEAKLSHQLDAMTPEEMLNVQDKLIAWFKSKVASTAAEGEELRQAYEHAVKRKWKSGTLKRHAMLSAKRLEFYKKILTALEAGYVMVPHFPTVLFAVRTTKAKPTGSTTAQAWASPAFQQPAMVLPAGHGDYQNPFPVVCCGSAYKQKSEDGHEAEKKNFWATDWDGMEFPVSMARPRIMEAASKAMALKIFDELGILDKHKDPLIVGNIIDPSPRFGDKKKICFMLAWHLDVRTI